MIGHINFDAKLTGKRSAGNPHAAFDEAGVGNGLNSTAPTPDPTCEGHSKSIAPANAGDKVRFRYVYSTKSNDPHIGPLIRKKIIKGDLKRLFNQTSGLLVSIGAYTESDKLESVLNMVKAQAKQKYMSKGMSYLELVSERRGKYFPNKEENGFKENTQTNTLL